MSARPEPPEEPAARQAPDDTCSLHWLALLVLMLCWLAEAYV